MRTGRITLLAVLTFCILPSTLAISQENDSRLRKELEAGLNKQINEEMFSSYLYLSMAAHFESVNLPGFAQLDAGADAGREPACHDVL